MSGLARILALRDVIISVTFANNVLSVLTQKSEVISYDFITKAVSEH